MDVVVVEVALVGLFGFVISSEKRESRDLEEIRDPSAQPSDGLGRDDTPLTETSSADSGGTGSPCGSVFLTDPDAICIELCVEYCECETDLQCPSGFACSDVIEGVGVCL